MTAVIETFRLGNPPWPTMDPFLFAVHHDDAYPAGNEHLGPEASLAGRELGMDFAGKDGWRMYHGDTVPGFPGHPHRGFETVTIVRNGLIDHHDSLGAAARFGKGDVQWLTAGKGIVHSEMFPLLERDKPNPAELFQIWLNLPAASKMVNPYFSMLWSDAVPHHVHRDANGKVTDVTVVAGPLGDIKPPSPPPDSWASRPDADIAIWTITMEPGATWTIPAAKAESNRVLYVFTGSVTIEDDRIENSGVHLSPTVPVEIAAGDAPVDILLLQGKPIGEPVVQYGPFVMNTKQEIQQAFADYQRTRFGGWPWDADAPVLPREQARFARHPDGRVEKAPSRQD
ncbi:MAG: pirin family protein [Myxococcota bacterium]|nr:pirin family protein [Deltaproteobacteria bacterium]MDQ3335804.1 pirin family protein [Myxococcota bacterium]